MSYQYQVKMQVWKVIEWQNGSVYKTMSLGAVWIPADASLSDLEMNDIAKLNGGDFLRPMGTHVPYNEQYRTINLITGKLL